MSMFVVTPICESLSCVCAVVSSDGNNILIDDRESNIQQWREAGGIGILYKSADQVNKELDKLGL